jgi:hypothetical protein
MLLDKNPSKRPDANKIKTNAWLVDIDWDTIINQKAGAPIKPSIKNDIRN